MSMLDLSPEQRKKLLEEYKGKATDDVSEKPDLSLATKLGSQMGDFASVNPYAGMAKFKPQAINVGQSDADSEMEARRKALMSLRGY